MDSLIHEYTRIENTAKSTLDKKKLISSLNKKQFLIGRIFLQLLIMQ